ncbi:MAG: hypothetical protein U9N46_05620 [Euryarchaeota archaeon]|nr:hypothetical protein [Euryarchaeota archaeon]
MKQNRNMQQDSGSAKISSIVIFLIILALLVIPAYCCEIYIQNEAGEYVITIEDVTNVGVCDLNLTYDSNLVNITSITGGDFDYFDYNYVDSGSGDDYASLYLQAFQTANQGLNEVVDYARLTLRISDDEQGKIGIDVVELVEESPDVKPIPYTVQDFAVSEPPSVTVNSPDGQENRKAGSSVIIGWTATDNVGVTSIDIAYSVDGGATYQTITTGISGGETYNWTIPATLSGACLVKVTAHDAAGNVGEGVSVGDFTIIAAPQATTEVTSDRTSGEGTYPPGWGATPTPTSPSTSGEGTYPPGWGATPTSPSTSAPASTAVPAATQEPETVTEFRTEPKSSLPPILTPIAGVVIVVIASIMGGIVKVIALTTAHPEPARSETEGRTDTEAVAPVEEEREWKKALAAIIGIVIIAVVAIIAMVVI